VLKEKLLFHKATNVGLDWDNLLPEDIRIAFDKLHCRLPELQNIQIPRWVATPRQPEERKKSTLSVMCLKRDMGVLYMNAP
jgi:hypothetical protein